MSHTVLGSFPSSSSDSVYEVKIDNSNGRLWCDCRGWKMKRANQPYGCKHTREVQTRKQADGWRFRSNWDEHTYLVSRGGANEAALPGAIVSPTNADAVARLAAATSAAPATKAAPSLEQVRAATKKPGYDVMRRTRRNIEVE